MDKLEKFITQNKEQFDVYEPNPKLWHKIKVRKQGKEIRIINWKGVLWKAAAVIIIFTMSFLLQEHLHRNDIYTTKAGQYNNNDEQGVSELLEAEVYYTSMISNKLIELKTHTTVYPCIEQELEYDLSELDNIYAELKEDFKDDIDRDEVIEAMIQNYRLKLKILEDLLQEVKKAEKNNDNNAPKIEV